MNKVNWQVFKIFFILFLLTLLTSCSTHLAKNDGPPNFYVDETKIPNAVPKIEPLAKYGNLSSYRVFGARYYTLKSSKHYQATGIASWYGTKFHSHRTSSGEKYDMLAMTAAHKTLPLPTYLEVTNLKNRRKIIVKVNDRGPFASNRIIDLSYVAAKKLDMLGHGTAPVRLKAIDPYTFGRKFELAENNKRFTNHSLWSPNKKQHQFYLQVGAFHNRIHAEKLRERLIAMLEAPVKISPGKLYRVQIGPIKDMATANKITQRLRTIGITPDKKFGL